MLPKDPVMLLSAVNMKLRDRYESMDALCEDMDVSADEIISALDGIGYVYNKETNQFI